MKELSIAEINMREVTNDPHLFCKCLGDARASQRYGGLVNARVPEDFAADGTRLFLSDDNLAGCAVERDGNITAVFKHICKHESNVPDSLLLTALRNGGYKLDCYGGCFKEDCTPIQSIGYLPSLYMNYGFIPVARVMFDSKFAEPGFAAKYDCERDIIVFLHNRDDIETVISHIRKYTQYSLHDYLNLPIMEYAGAIQYRESLITQFHKS